MKDLFYACEVDYFAKKYQLLLIIKGVAVMAHLIELAEDGKHKNLGFHEVKDFSGRATLVPRIVLLELKNESGKNLRKFQKICRHRVKAQLFPRDTKFRVMK
jgi:hypothetical protein